ncbi:hypothetical protein [Alkalibaculum sporogenes]|nr:hypothetical protein [Alkalibaculum sporogenes]
MEDKTVLEILDELKETELQFLPNDEAREGFMTIVKFMLLAI